MWATSDLWTNPDFVRFLLRFLDFFVKMWLLKACFLLIFPEPVNLKRFLALDLVFIFGILLLFYIVITYLFYFFFGLIIIIILLPISCGICSTTPRSSISWANFNNKISPLSLNTIVLPLKKTYAFTLAPSERKALACFNLKSKSCASVLGP